jgi:aminoglycoside phosphotransferase (APT) family kinase protein
LRAAWPLAHSGPAVLLHGDYWPGNWLWRDGRLAAVIDWEDAGAGDPLRDLATSRLEVAWIFGPEASRAYTAQYRALMAVDEHLLAYWDLYSALRLARMVGDDLAGWSAFFAPYGRADLTPEVLQRRVEAFVGEAVNRAHLPF